MDLIGYASDWSVTPGDSIRFMVSTNAPSFDMQLVRLYCGDDRAPGLGFHEVEVESNADGAYPGRVQHTTAGSYMVTKRPIAYDSWPGICMSAWIYPTTPSHASRQGIVSALDSRTLDSIAGLGLTPDGVMLTMRGESILPEPSMLVSHYWYWVAASYDNVTGRAFVACVPMLTHHDPALTQVLSERQLSPNLLDGGNQATILVGAAELNASPDGDPTPRGLYNGKVERPTVTGRPCMNREELFELAHAGPSVMEGVPLYQWQFGHIERGCHVPDSSGIATGHLINAPEYNVTSHSWTGQASDPGVDPGQYDAAHFHEDDLADARWNPDFTLKIPTDLPSGVYAARLRTKAPDGEDHIPFVVRPATGHRKADAAVLLPTLTYLAYANERIPGTGPYGDFWKPEDDPLDDVLAGHLEWGLSLYDRHTDGCGWVFSSRLRPIPNLRPKYRSGLVNAPRHLSGDLYLIEWLARKGFAVDVLTDEDLHRDGLELIRDYKVLMTGSHPEYVTARMLESLEGYVEGGGNLMYLGGNGFYWVTSVDPHRPYLIEVRRGHAGTRQSESAPGEWHHSTTGEPGGLWRYRGHPPNRLTGVGFAAEGWDGQSPGYRRLPASHDPRLAFVFAGVEDEVIGNFGFVMNGAAGDEIDRFDLQNGSPPSTAVLATSQGAHSDAYCVAIEDQMWTSPLVTGSRDDRVRADMTMRFTPAGGAVFSVGSISWCGSLCYNGCDNNVSRVTENVLTSFLGSQPGA